jgi:ABC-type multidrug transport system ATPase subunit
MTKGKNCTICGKSDRKDVLNGVGFLVKEGEVLGLLGHNGMLIKVLNIYIRITPCTRSKYKFNFVGAGKTSTMKIIIAEETPDSGQV